MSKIVKTTHNPNPYNILSQTPPNFVKDNYYLRTLQDKVEADWDYRYNRADIDFETIIGSNAYEDLEVVIQNIKNDKGEKVADDYRRLVFRDIKFPVRLGQKYRFPYEFVDGNTELNKNVWLTVNHDSIMGTASAVVRRCNGTIASIYKNSETQMNELHYEEAISSTALSSTNFDFDPAIVTQKSDLTIIVQFNKYTEQYYVNQRFIVGYNQVYKVTAIQNTDSLNTYNPKDVGVIILYANVDEKSAKDDFVKRLAYNNEDDDVPATDPVIDGDYTYKVYKPLPIPTELYSDPTEFGVGLFNSEVLVENKPITINIQLGRVSELGNLDGVDLNSPNIIKTYDGKYLSMTDVDDASNYVETVSNNGFGVFVIRRLRYYAQKDAVITAKLAAEDSPSGNEMVQAIVLSLGGLE